MAYYRNSSSGCGELLVAIVLVITVGTLLVKGCVSLLSSIDFDGDWNRKPVKTDNHVWGEHGVDPVLRTSTGAIYKDPAYPNYYFDITLENQLLGSRDSWFTDIYLDVVMMPDGRLDLLDADELDDAFRCGEITEEQHRLAHAWADELMAELPANLPKLRAFCEEMFAQLKGEEK